MEAVQAKTRRIINVPKEMLEFVEKEFDRAYAKGARFWEFPRVCVEATLRWQYGPGETPPRPCQERVHTIAFTEKDSSCKS